jgi:hypothetical protein
MGDTGFHLLPQDRIGMHRQPAILPIAPHMVGQAESHRRRAWRVALSQALVRHHAVGEADPQPESSPVAGLAPGQTAGAAPQGGAQSPQRAIPSFPKGRLDRRAEWSQAQLLHKAAGTANRHAPADLHHLPRWVTDLDDLGVQELLWDDQPGFGRPSHLPPPSTTRENAHNLEQRGARGFPTIGEKDGEVPPAGNDLSPQRGGLLLRAGADVAPEQKPTPHRQGRLDPRHLTRTPCGMRLLHLDTGHVHLVDNLAMMGRSTMGSAPLQAMHCCESHGTNIGGSFITDAPPLTLQQLYDWVFGELAAGPQGALPFRELPGAYCTAQPFKVLVRPGPRPMHDVALAGTIEACAWWMRARESRLSLWRWRR